MNHLRELIEQKQQGAVLMGGKRPMSKREADLCGSLFREAENAMCFSLGSLGSIPNFGRPEFDRLPYETAWFEVVCHEEATGAELVVGVLAHRADDEGGTGGLVFVRYGKRWYFEGFFFWQPGAIRVGDFDQEESPAIHNGLFAMGACLKALRCTNVAAEEQKPSEKLNAARKKRGKQPLFSYWTLVVRGKTGDATPVLGGTHESPRVHLRRGHPREYAPGKWTWVQECVVGNPSLGMVHKDYLVEVA